MHFFLVFSLLIFFSWLYLKLAGNFGIVDRPNERSSHQQVTVRGLGILFPLATFLYFFWSGFAYPYMSLGLLVLSVVSFLDDLVQVANRYRLLAQFMAIGFLFLELSPWHLEYPFLLLPLLAVILVGILNAYNFMDGINGLTGVYSLLNFGTLYYINLKQVPIISQDLLLFLMIGQGVFLFFNFRKRAVAFCGDVGSIGIAYLLLFAISNCILATGDWKYIFLLSVYGLDSIYTLVYRLWLKENIFKAHRKHFYQILVNERAFPHLGVSILYCLIQLALNVYILSKGFTYWGFGMLLLCLVFAMHLLRKRWGMGINYRIIN